MKAIKFLLKATLVLLPIAVLAVAGTVYYVVHHPKETWTLIEEKFLPKDLKISWDEIQFDSAPQSARFWKPSLGFTNLCITKKDPAVDVCLDQFKLNSSVSFEHLLKPSFEVNELVALSKHDNFFKPGPKKQKDNEPEQSFHEMAQSWQQRLKKYSGFMQVHQVHLDFAHFELRSSQSTPMVFSALVKSDELLQSAQIEFGLKKEPGLSLQSKGDLSLNHFINAQGQFAKLQLQLEHPKAKVKVPQIEVVWKEQSKLLVDLNLESQIPQARLENKTHVQLDEKKLAAELEMTVLYLKKPFDHLKPIRASVNVPQEKRHLWAREKSDFKASALIPVFFVDREMRSSIEKTCQCQLPEELALDVAGNANLAAYFDEKDGEIANVEAKLQSLTNSLFTTKTGLQASVFREKGEWKISPVIDSDIILNSFQGLALLMRTQKIAIPAPLANLDGKITLSAHGPIERSTENWEIPFTVQTDLKSSRQVVNIASNGTVDVLPEAKSIAANVDVLLKDVTLQLPPLEPVYGVPKITPDKRIQVEPPKPVKNKKPAFKIQLAVHVHSERPDSLRLLYPLAKPYIPIAVNIDFTSANGLKGDIALSPFQVEYLKRKSTIEKFQLSMNQPEGVFPMKGRFRVDQSQYKIYIDVLGTAAAPHVVLSSDPYLDRNDIISVLLYGRTNDQLVAADAQTVGSFDAAMADRAIGLLGLWAFSSTPIQSFSYNQLNQQYSAQLKVTDDTSLSVGTNWEQATSLELRKRLSDHWMVSAALEPTEDEQQTRKLRLQWEDRF